MLERRLILRGIAAGGISGLIAAIWLRFMAEPWIQKSINFQDSYDTVENRLLKAAHQPLLPPGPNDFSRSTQRNVGAPIGMIVFGMAMGALFAVIFILLHRRYGDTLKPRLLSVAVAAAAFLGIYGIPYLKYPANPPGIGHPDTIHARGNLYLGMVAVSIVSLIAAFFAGRLLVRRWGGWNGSIVTAIGFIAWMAIIMAVFPALGHLHQNVVQYGKHATETPQPLYSHGRLVYPGFPADTLFKFRLYSVLNQLLLWASIGLTFGLLAERALAQAGARRRARAAAPVAA